MDILIIVIALFWYGLADFKPMWKQKAYKDLVVSGVTISIALCLIWMQRSHLDIPNPMEGIKQVYTPVDAWMRQHMK